MKEEKGRAPAFQYYPDRIESSTSHLSKDAFVAHIKIMNWMWLHSPDYCSMNHNPTAWRIATGISDPDMLTRVTTELLEPECPLLRKINGKIYNMGLKREREKQQSRSNQASDASNTRWDEERKRKKKEVAANRKKEKELRNHANA